MNDFGLEFRDFIKFLDRLKQMIQNNVDFKNRRSIIMTTPNKILKEAMALKPSEKVELIDKLISSLDEPDGDIDKLWSEESESRIDAYERGEIKAVTMEKVLEKYR